MVIKKIVNIFFISGFLVLILSCKEEQVIKDPVTKFNTVDNWFSRYQNSPKDTIVVFEHHDYKETFTVNRLIKKDEIKIKHTIDSNVYSDLIEIEYSSQMFKFYFKLGIAFNNCYGHSLYLDYYSNEGMYHLFGNLDTGIVYNNSTFIHQNLLKYYKQVETCYHEKTLYNVYEVNLTHLFYNEDPNDICYLYISEKNGLVHFVQNNQNEWHLNL